MPQDGGWLLDREASHSRRQSPLWRTAMSSGKWTKRGEVQKAWEVRYKGLRLSAQAAAAHQDILDLQRPDRWLWRLEVQAKALYLSLLIRHILIALLYGYAPLSIQTPAGPSSLTCSQWVPECRRNSRLRPHPPPG